MAVSTWLGYQARRAPRALAVRAGERNLSFGALDERVASAAGVLAAAGLGAGDRLGVVLPGTVEHLVALHAAQRLGAVHTPLDPRLPEDELARRLEVAEARVVVVAEGAVSSRLGRSAGRTIAAAELAGGGPGAAAGTAAAPPALDSPATWIFTSGTTGAAEPVPLTAGNHLASAVASALNLGSRADDAWLCCLPLAHVGGLAIVFRSVLAGVPLVLEDGFDAERVAAQLAGGEVTLASLVPTMLTRLLERDAPPPSPRLRAILLGGGPIEPALVAAARERGFPALPTYGMTETASQVATAPPRALGGAIRTGEVGPPLFGVELAIHGPDGERWAAGELSEIPGEIRVRGPMVAPSRADAEGWLHTGDLGRLDADGTLVVAGRRDEMIVTGGENVSPPRVEEALFAHPEVAECAVVGVPDPEWGRAVAAAVVLRRHGGEGALAALADHCRQRLAPFEVPKRWRVVESLPRTALGKVARDDVRRLFETDEMA